MFSAGLIGVVAEILMTGILAMFIALLFSCCDDVITVDLTAVVFWGDVTITVGFWDDVTAAAGLITAIFCDDVITDEFGAICILKLAGWGVAFFLSPSSPEKFNFYLD